MDNYYKFYNLNKKEETLILEQIKYLHEEFVSIQQIFVGIISVALAVYAVVIYYALSSEKNEIFLLLPFLFSLSIYNLLKYTVRVLGIDAYISHLEKLINTTHQKSLFLWQSYLAYANKYTPFGVLPQLPCFFVMGIFLIYRFYLAILSTTYPFYLILSFIILLLIQIICLVLMGINCLTQYRAVLEICKTIPPNLTSKEDIQKLIKIKPQQLYLHKLFSRFISKYMNQKN